jgi:hypothetical protein
VIGQTAQFPDDEGVDGAELVQELLEGGAVGAAPLAVSVNTRLQPARAKASTWSEGCWSVGEDAGIAERVTHTHERCRTL